MDYEYWKQMWRCGRSSERLGQAFVNDFISDMKVPLVRQIYYKTDYWEADELITQWLMENCYYPNVPARAEDHV